MSAQPPQFPAEPRNVLVTTSGAPVPGPAPTVPVAVRPFWRDPLFLAGAGLFLWNVAEGLAGKEFTAANVRDAVFGGFVAVGRALAPYVRSFIPWFDRPAKAALAESRKNGDA